MKSLFPTLLFVTTALGASRTSAPRGCITVAKSGGDFTTVQSAVNSISSASGSVCIFINPGTYDEQVLIPALGAQLTIYGSTRDDTSYASNTVTLTHHLSQADGLPNDKTATLRVKAAGLKLYNVNVSNTYGKGSQAVALSAYSDSGFYGCAITGFQDTLLSQQGNQVYVKCLIQGATDFIFGQHARSLFERVDIRVLEHSVGYITANGRNSSDDPSFYLFNKCNIAAASGQSVKPGIYYLGRPWGDHARVVIQRTSMTSVINPAGWSIWNTGDERTCCVLFGEYKNTGSVSGKRAAFAMKLSKAVSIEDIFGTGYAKEAWFDADYYAGK